MTCTSPHLPLWSVSFVNPWGPSAVIGPELVTWWRHWALIGPYQLWIWGWAWKLQWTIHPHPQDISRLELTQPSQAEDEIKLGKLKYLFFPHWNFKSKHYIGCIHLFRCHSLCPCYVVKCCKGHHSRPVGIVQFLWKFSWGFVITSFVEVVDI